MSLGSIQENIPLDVLHGGELQVKRALQGLPKDVVGIICIYNDSVVKQLDRNSERRKRQELFNLVINTGANFERINNPFRQGPPTPLSPRADYLERKYYKEEMKYYLERKYYK